MTVRNERVGWAAHGRRCLCALIAAVGVMSMQATAATTTLSFVSTTSGVHGTLGKYTGSMTWDSSSQELKVTINVLATTATGGKLTGVAFGGPVGAGMWSLIQAPTSFAQLGGASAGSINAQPFGYFNAGAGNGSNWMGGTPDPNGIAAGHSATFVFKLVGSGLPTDVSAFWQTHPNNPNGQPQNPPGGAFGLVARFQGFDATVDPEDPTSDKSPAILQMVVVPVPAPVLLAGLGLIGVAAARRRFSAR